ncbi:MAG: nuclear transport factor 2 family protein, partial [Planctomycetota bacterium]
MSWKVRPFDHSIPCDGNAVRLFRKNLDWTQKTLATKSGYSERLIRKAEAGEPLDPETIEHLAEALTFGDQTIAPEDLCMTPLVLVQNFISAFVEFGSEGVAAASRDYFSDDLEIWIAGDPAINPCSGSYQGHQGLREYFERLSKTFEVLAFEPTWSAHGSEVFVHGIQTLRRVGGTDQAVVWGVNHYLIHDGKIAVWKNH